MRRAPSAWGTPAGLDLLKRIVWDKEKVKPLDPPAPSAEETFRLIAERDGRKLPGQEPSASKNHRTRELGDDNVAAAHATRQASEAAEQARLTRELIAQRYKAAADSFKLGQSARDNLAGQGSLFEESSRGG